MSAYLVDKKLIDYLVVAATQYNRSYTRVSFGGEKVRRPLANVVGCVLWHENLTSVLHRYPDCRPDDLPGPVPTPRIADYELSDFQMIRTVIEPVKLLAALSCYEYQSCEHPGWETSDSKAFCAQLRDVAITELPGYDEAGW